MTHTVKTCSATAELGQTLPRQLDLSALALLAGIIALVVPGQQQNDLFAVGVAEDAEQDRTLVRLSVGCLVRVLGDDLSES